VIARVKAITKRDYVTFSVLKKDKDIITIGDLKLNVVTKDLDLKGESVALTKKEFEILSLLMQHPQKIFTRKEILDEVWKNESYVLERTVDVHVARLRKKLDEYGAYITNRSGYGYTFNDSARIYKHENNI
jgi:DNA-binding response OmpR family regulator